MRLALALLAALIVAPAAFADDTAAPIIEHKQAATVTTDKQGLKWVPVIAKITDESKFFPQIFFRYGAGEYNKPIDMKAVKGQKNMFGGNIPVKGDLVEYYIEAYDDYGNGPGRSGDPEKPWRVDTTGQGAIAEATPAMPQKKVEPKPEPVVERPAPRKVAERPSPRAQPSGGRTWTWIVGGTGLGLLAGGGVAGLAMKTADDAYQQRLKDPANGPASLQAQYDANKSLGQKATILMAAGGALVATSIVLFFLEAPSAPKDDGAGLVGGITPVEGGATVALAGHF